MKPSHYFFIIFASIISSRALHTMEQPTQETIQKHIRILEEHAKNTPNPQEKTQLNEEIGKINAISHLRSIDPSTPHQKRLIFSIFLI